MQIKSIEQLSEEWSKDSIVDKTEPSAELAKIPQIQAKYLRIMTQHNLILAKINSDIAKEKKFKFEYYRGDPNAEEEMEKRGITDYYKHSKILNANLDIYLESDNELINLNLKKALHSEIVNFCNTVLKELNNRTYQLNGIIKWELFTRGAG